MPKQGSRHLKNQMADPRLPTALAEKAVLIDDNKLQQALIEELAKSIRSTNSTPVEVVRQLECIFGDLRDFALKAVLSTVDEKYGRCVTAISDGAVRSPNR